MAAPQGHSGPEDSELVAAVLGGDRAAFAMVYDRYADRLYDFCAAMLRDPEDAADAVQDTFVLVAERLSQLRDPQRLRPWLYAIARSVALRRLRGRARSRPVAEVDDHADPTAGPEGAAAQRHQRELVWAAAAGLADRDRALFDLHLRQGLEGEELGAAMGVSTEHCYVLLSRLRDRVERSLGALLIARLGRKGCAELDALLSGWDGRFSPLVRKRVARHVDGCEVCGDRKRRLASPWALLAAVPPVAAPAALRDRVLGEVQLVAHSTAPSPSGTSGTSGTSSRTTRTIAAGAIALVLASAAAVLALIGPDQAAGTAVGTGQAVGSAPAAPSAVAPPTGPPPAGPPDAATPGVAPPGGVVPAAPRVLTQSASPTTVRKRPCSTGPETSSVRATVDAPAGIASVTLSRTGVGGPRSAPMTPGSGGWVAALGPFLTFGTVSWQVTVTDELGRTASGPTGVVTVSPCPPPPTGPGGLTI